MTIFEHLADIDAILDARRAERGSDAARFCGSGVGAEWLSGDADPPAGDSSPGEPGPRTGPEPSGAAPKTEL